MQKFEKEELLGIFISIVVAVGFFAAVRYEPWRMLTNPTNGNESTVSGDVVTLKQGDEPGNIMQAVGSAVTARGKVEKLIVQDVKEGTGAEVKDGSTVTVNYIGMLQNGTQFDNSYKRSQPYTFVVGKGSVIKGWDVGIVGMKAGGERILVIPPDMAYGAAGSGPIPPNSALLFSVEVVNVQ